MDDDKLLRVSLVSAMASLTPPAAGQTTLSQNYQEQLSTRHSAANSRI